MKRMIKSASLIPYTFVLMNWAPVAGLFCFVKSRPRGIWGPATVKHT